MADTQDLDTQDTLDQTTDWREGLDVSIKSHPAIAKYKSVGDMAKGFVEAQKLIGVDKIPVPGEKATKEDWDMVFDRLGRPKAADGYTLPSLKFPDGYPAPKDEFMKEFKTKALELGMLPAQVNGLYEWFMNEQIGEFNQFGQARETERSQAENSLRKLWGKAFEQNYAIAEQAVNKYGSEKFVNKLKETGLNNDPDMIEFIANMAKNLSEDKIAGKPQGYTLSPEEALAEIAKIKGDPKHPYWSKLHPEHDYAMQKMKDLFEMANPGTA